MRTPTNPVLHTPAHKQVDPTAKPGQISVTGRMVSTPTLQQIPRHTPEADRLRNVWVQAVKQDKEQVK